MKKIAIVIGVVLALLIAVGIAGGSKSSNKPSITTTTVTAPAPVVVVPTVPTTQPAPVTPAVDCVSLSTSYQSVLNSYASLVSRANPASASDIATVKSYGIQVVVAGRELIAVCPQYASIGPSLDVIENGVNSLQ